MSTNERETRKRTIDEEEEGERQDQSAKIPTTEAEAEAAEAEQMIVEEAPISSTTVAAPIEQRRTSPRRPTQDAILALMNENEQKKATETPQQKKEREEREAKAKAKAKAAAAKEAEARKAEAAKAKAAKEKAAAKEKEAERKSTPMRERKKGEGVAKKGSFTNKLVEQVEEIGTKKAQSKISENNQNSDLFPIDTSSSKNVSNILPPVVVDDKPYFEIKQECKGSEYEPSVFMPKLTGIINDVKTNGANSVTNVDTTSDTLVEVYESDNSVDTYVKQGSVRVGLRADISIVKVRKTAWETLAAALVNYAKEIKPEPEPEQSTSKQKKSKTGITETGIYKTNNKEITLFVQENQGGKIYSQISESFNLTVLGQVFVGANVDEPEEHSGGALTRQTMTDKTEPMKTVDEAMLKIISILFLLMNINSGQASEDAKQIIQAFIATSSAKEYLDIGQLYAICGPTIKLNKKRGYEKDEILARCEIYFNGSVAMDTEGGMKNNSDDDDSTTTNGSKEKERISKGIASLKQTVIPANVNFISPIKVTGKGNNSELSDLSDLDSDVDADNLKTRVPKPIPNQFDILTQTDGEFSVSDSSGNNKNDILIQTNNEDPGFDSADEDEDKFEEEEKQDANDTQPDTSLEWDPIFKQRYDPVARDRYAASKKAPPPALDATQTELVSNVPHITEKSKFRPPHKPMLESIDGAATRIAANQFFTAYCGCTLENDVTKQKDESSFVIDNNDVFLLTIWFSKANPVIQEFANEFTKNANLTNESKAKIDNKFYEMETDINNLNREIEAPNLDHKIKIEKLQEIDNLINLNTLKQIDICYYILENYSGALKRINEKIKDALVIEKKYYDIFSVACFLYKYNSTPAIVEDLIKCNFDPLCHDNKDSQVYRLIMVLIFILKNSTPDIKDNLKLMFPSYFKRVKGTLTNNWKQEKITSLNDTEVGEKGNKQKIFLEPEPKKEPEVVNDYYNYINKYILECLDPDQQNFFKILAGNTYDKIEERLYTRLLTKSCYVFQVKNDAKDIDKNKDNFVVVVSSKTSANNAFTVATATVYTPIKSNAPSSSSVNPKRMLSSSNLNTNIFLPKYTYCAIDAPLKHGLSLAQHDITSGYSKVYMTAVTRNDAAAQRKLYAGQYLQPICIDIDVENILTESSSSREKSYFNFTYKYEYGAPLSDNDLVVVPDIILNNPDSNLSQQYVTIITNLNNHTFNFNFNKKNKEELREEINNIKENFLKKVYEETNNDNTIRDAFSRLIDKSIMGTKKDNVTEGKAQFINFVIKYISENPNNIEKIKKLLYYATMLLELSSQTIVDNLINMIAQYNLYPNVDENDNSSNNISSAKKGRKGKEGGGLDTTNLSSVSSPSSEPTSSVANPPFYFNKPEIRIETTEPEPPLLEPKPEFPIEPGSGLNEQAKGVGINEMPVKIQAEPNELPNGLQYSYSTLFGKYGFEMAINEDGEYELHILDTPEQYAAYLRKYGLSEEEDEPVQEQEQGVGQQTQQQVVAAAGGKRKKTKKHKRVKHNTRRFPKLRLNKSKRKVVRKATKTRSKK